MTRQELFAKYHVNEGHEVWKPAIDNWFSVEIYRVMHDGNLPKPDDASILYVLDFLDRTKDSKFFFGLDNPGSYFTTAHRMVYRYADQILAALKAGEGESV